MKYYIIAGERSGDLHGGNLIAQLRAQDPESEIRAWGGNEMEAAGAELVTHYREMAFMGFVEVLQNLSTIKGFLKKAKQDLLDYKPDVLILIDYAGFNLRMARFAHDHGIRVHYYISPKLWAWNPKRAKKIKRNVDRMFAILPFEQDFYKQFDTEVDYVGNPLLDAIRKFTPNESFREQHQLKQDEKIIAVLPGSRYQEVSTMLNQMLDLIPFFPEYQWVVAGVDNLPDELYASAQEKGVKVVYGETYDLLSNAYAAVVTSGTATLETALFEVPQVVCYKTSLLTFALAEMLMTVPYISLVNLIAEEKVVEELKQFNFNPERLRTELNHILEGTGREKMLEKYKGLKRIMGNKKASQETARLIVEDLKTLGHA